LTVWTKVGAASADKGQANKLPTHTSRPVNTAA